MAYLHGRLIKQIGVPSGSIHIVARHDGTFQFHEVVRLADGGRQTAFTSGIYISAETAEVAAKRKFKL